MSDWDKGIPGGGRGGIVRSVQRGVVAAAGTVAVNRVDINKAVVLSVSKGSAGTVAATGAIVGTVGGNLGSATVPNNGGTSTSPMTLNATLSGGTTNLTTAQYSARLIGPTTLAVDGPCEWQLLEYT